MLACATPHTRASFTLCAHGGQAHMLHACLPLAARRGANTGCLHASCIHAYHYTCARIRAYQGYLRFSLFDRSMACMEHLPM
jgi:hypothetical protein